MTTARADERAEGLRALAASVRAGSSVREALLAWPEECPAALREAVERLGRRLRLGDPVPAAIAAMDGAFGGDADVVAGVLAIHGELGGDVAAMLDTIAGGIAERGEAGAAAAAAGAGAKLSGRLVAGLPLAFIPLMPAARAPLFDGTGLALLVAGVALALAGMRWIGRLVPRPPGEDGAALIALVAAGVVRGGTGLHAALDCLARQAPVDVRAALLRARRRVQLGTSWSRALEQAESESLRMLGATLQRADRRGVPVADSLLSFVERRRAEAAREFDRATRRAPILMVVPLVVCVLPAYALLGLAPFLRGLATGS